MGRTQSGDADTNEITLAAIGRTFREESGRSVATLIRVFGDIDIAEDAVQEAFTVALRRWPVEGRPANPGGWITTTARRRAIDRLRRASREQELLRTITASPVASPDPATSPETGPLPDDSLRLIFTCCHPALSAEAQVALTLRLLGGLSTGEVARAFLVAEATMAQRLVRAKRKIKAAGIPYRVPDPEDLPTRLRPVLSVLYLIYNAGADGPGGADLRSEAIRLTRAVAALMPAEEEVAGLLALMLLLEARRPARFDTGGALVLLGDQDRGLWNRSLAEEGQAIVRACLQRDRPGPYQLQAAINAVHADASEAEATDWRQIVALYSQLLAIAPTPIVALNRAIAVGEVEGPAPALALVDALPLDHYHLFHATRAALLRRLTRTEEAVAAYTEAVVLAPSDTDRRFLEDQLAALRKS